MGAELALALILLAGNAFFVGVEFSVARLRPTQVAEFERSRRPGAKSARHAVDHIDAYLAACQLGITICSLGLGAVGKPAFEELLEPVLGEESAIAGIALSVLVGFTVITVLHIVVGELSPKSLAIARTGPTALVLAPPMRVFYLASRPLVDLFNWMGNLLLRPFGIPPASEAGHAPHTEDELRELLREAVQGGEIAAEEAQLGENVLLFGDRRAREVMRPRPEVDFVRTTESIADAAARAIGTGRTRLPLCEPEGGLDAAVGVINAKDLLEPVMRGADVRLEDLARPLARVSDSTLIDELLRDLRRRRQHVALVLDEHGTAVGLVTMEDILEEIVGEIEDEFDPREAELVRETPEGLVVDGATPVRLVAERLDADLEDHHEATIGGLVVERLGRLPAAGERVDLEGHAAEVTRVGDAVIEELRFDPARRPDERSATAAR